MHVITINITTCDTGHLHIHSLTNSEHKYPQDYVINCNVKTINLLVNFYKHDKITFKKVNHSKSLVKGVIDPKYIHYLKSLI